MKKSNNKGVYEIIDDIRRDLGVLSKSLRDAYSVLESGRSTSMMKFIISRDVTRYVTLTARLSEMEQMRADLESLVGR